jgi:hypothetical protein
MDADPIPETFRPSANVLHNHFVDIPTSRTEQSNDVSRSVVPQMGNLSPTPVIQMAADGRSSKLQWTATQVLNEEQRTKSGFSYPTLKQFIVHEVPQAEFGSTMRVVDETTTIRVAFRQ